MDRAFTALLFLVAASGLALWGAGGHASLPLWLAFHLATVMALFLTLPYGKFAHALFRGAALVRHAVVPLLDALEKLTGERVQSIFQNTQAYFRDVADHLERIHGVCSRPCARPSPPRSRCSCP